MTDVALDGRTFAALMAPLEPFRLPAGVPLAVAVSGGADSLALAVLAAEWAAARGIALLALVVDHALRPGSAEEAQQTAARLHGLAITTRQLTIEGLVRGPALAERARDARYAVLFDACHAAGAVDLLLGHHRGDQAETILMRSRRAPGAVGMALLAERGPVRLLRPLLPIAPEQLRAFLRGRGIGWVEDPSNRDPSAERTRARAELHADAALCAATLRDGALTAAAREKQARADAEWLSRNVTLRPEGFAVLPAILPLPSALAALLRTIAGRRFLPPRVSVEALCRQPRPATLWGARLIHAGRFGPGWLLIREAASIGAPSLAQSGNRWDGRFVLDGGIGLSKGASIAALGAGSEAGRGDRTLPDAVKQTLPSIRDAEGRLLAVPHLRWAVHPDWAGIGFRFQPTRPASESVPFTLS